MRSGSRPAAAWPAAAHRHHVVDRLSATPLIALDALTKRYPGGVVALDGLTLDLEPGIIGLVGANGAGKSTMLKHLIGLKEPVSGDVLYGGRSFWTATDQEREQAKRQFGVLFQGGALWSSMTLAENVALPLRLYTSLTDAEVRDITAYKLSLVGLAGFEQYYPSELSGGMRKRAGLAIGDRAVFLDAEAKTQLAVGDPRVLRDSSPDPRVRNFLSRGEADGTA